MKYQKRIHKDVTQTLNKEKEINKMLGIPVNDLGIEKFRDDNIWKFRKKKSKK